MMTLDGKVRNLNYEDYTWSFLASGWFVFVLFSLSSNLFNFLMYFKWNKFLKIFTIYSLGQLSPGQMKQEINYNSEAVKRQLFINDVQSSDSEDGTYGSEPKLKKRRILKGDTSSESDKTSLSSSSINLPLSGETVIISSPYVVPEDNDETFIISPDEDLERSMLEVEELICLEDDF